MLARKQAVLSDRVVRRLRRGADKDRVNLIPAQKLAVVKGKMENQSEGNPVHYIYICMYVYVPLCTGVGHVDRTSSLDKIYS